jgi:hypothetical protein
MAAAVICQHHPVTLQLHQLGVDSQLAGTTQIPAGSSRCSNNEATVMLALGMPATQLKPAKQADLLKFTNTQL